MSNTLNSNSSVPKDDSTPLMKQYWELKNQIPDGLLLFRMGDFYELFGDDAVTASQILEITLTTRDRNKPNPMPMAGVPFHSAQSYIQKLLNAGKKVAIGEQMEDPDTVKAGKIVRREIIRVLTPGVQFDAEGSEANYLAVGVKVQAGSGSRSAQTLWILACLDASTGESLVSQPLPTSSLAYELSRLPVRHLLQYEGTSVTEALSLSNAALGDSILVEQLPKNYLSREKAQEVLKRHYEVEALQAFVGTDEGIHALGTLVTYAMRTQQQDRLAHLRLPEPLQKPRSLALGPNTAQHLDLPELLSFIDRSRSTLGSRQVKRWLMAPLKSSAEIAERSRSVQELHAEGSQKREKISAPLSQVYDLERILGRISTRLANPRDTLALGQSLLTLKPLRRELTKFGSPLLQELHLKLCQLGETLDPLAEKIIRIQREEAPTVARDGGIFKAGTSPELDHLLSLSSNGQQRLMELENREKEKTGIPSLKVRYNRVFGYYIEITLAHLKNVPAHYQRKQTMVGAERFFTDELKRFEEEILTAASRQKSLEQELFNQLLEEIQKLSTPIMEAAKALGELDALLSLAQLGDLTGWSFPIVDDSLEIEIHSGRHPLVDQAKRGTFVPNDLHLSPQTRLTLLITGPNMGGKSTVMRQTALIILLGQIGAPVPAKKARWGTVSSLFTRIGAQDAISKGQSTFMVEMTELAHILHHADERSFIILDEIGRGTSTYDGMSVAWSTLEWICSRIRARTLFATHYHELIHLQSCLPLLANAHMAVEGGKSSSTLRFLYELREGPTNDSFGIHVAQLAGIPKPVIQRAWKVLKELENQTHRSDGQLSLFSVPDTESENPESEFPFEDASIDKGEPHPALQELEKTEINDLTPIQALNFVVKLKGMVEESAARA